MSATCLPLSPFQRRLWLAAVIWAGAVAALVGGAVAQSRSQAASPRSFGHDFLPSYAAGRLVLTGQSRSLYDPQAIAAVERDIARSNNLATDGKTGPFLNPPVYALLFVPLATMSYDVAAGVWMGASLLLLVASVVLLCRMLPSTSARAMKPHAGCGAKRRPGSFDEHQAGDIVQPFGSPATTDWRRWGLIPVLILASVPFWQAFHHQQNTFLSLFLLCAAVACWRSDRLICAGFAAGLLCFKPQLGAAFAAVLILATGWRALAGVAVAGGLLLLMNLLLLPGTLGDYVRALPPVVYDLQMRQPFNWSRQVTPHGFWRLLFQGSAAGETLAVARLLAGATALLFAAVLAAAVWRFRRSSDAEDRAPARDRLIVATIAAMPLVMPYFMDYDLLLLAVPAVLFAGDGMRRPRGDAVTPADRWQRAAWIALYVGVALPSLAPAWPAHVHMSLLVVAVVAAGQLWRAIRPAEQRIGATGQSEGQASLAIAA